MPSTVTNYGTKKYKIKLNWNYTFYYHTLLSYARKTPVIQYNAYNENFSS